MTGSDWGFSEEGYVQLPEGKIWYGIAGSLDSDETPLLVVHGGPGMSHDYLYPLIGLASSRPVIFYDQLDAGNSERLNLASHWTVNRFVSEIDSLCDFLALAQVSLFGNSWGGTIAAAYSSATAASRKLSIEKLVLSSPLINTDRWIADNAAYRDQLPGSVREILDRCEADGTTGSDAYLEAVDVFYKRHFCRSTPWPAYLEQTFNVLNEDCYVGMWGPNEFTCNGVLSGYDGSAALSSIAIPTLVTCGQFDEATPAACREYADLIPNSRFLEFENASHLAFIEVTESYLQAIGAFLGARNS